MVALFTFFYREEIRCEVMSDGEYVIRNSASAQHELCPFEQKIGGSITDITMEMSMYGEHSDLGDF